MPTAQDHAFALLVAQRGTVSPEGLAQARALMQQRPGSGQTLAQALLELRLLGPAAVAEALRELARSSFVCEPCHDLRGYDALARLGALQCPSCGRALAIVATAPRDSRLTHTLGDTAAGGAAFGGALRGRDHDTASRASGAHVLPSGAFGAVAPAAEDGRTIGPYQVIRELGRGSNGVVYLARRPGLARTFAVKMLLRENADPEAVRRFHQEATLASKIDDPGIIGVFDVGRHGAHDYYAMDYCPGTTLEERLKRGPLPHAEAARVVEQLARTVQAAHRQGVIHRDLKPANVILEEGAGRPRILDFGLARDRTQDQKLTRSGDVLGTPYYMAPEQIRGDRDLDHRIDVYALGVILYECLTGRRPFEATTVIELAHRIRHEEPPAPRTLQPVIPPRLEAICLRAMAKRADARHPTARHLADDLASALGDPGADPARRPRGAAERAAPRRRPAWLVGLGVAAVASAGLGVAAVTWPRGGSSVEEPRVGQGPVEAGADDREREVERHLERARALARERASETVVMVELERAATAAAGDERLQAAARLERARLLSRRGKHGDALSIAAELASAAGTPADVRAEALRLVAHGHERLGRSAAALDAWSRLRDQGPEEPAGRVAAAAMARLRGDAGAHRELAAKAAAQDPGYAPALLERALAERTAGDLDAAARAARAAADASPDCVTTQRVLALTALAGGDRAAARVALDDAIRLGEPEPEAVALTTRARLSADEGRLETALADVERVLARRPDDVEALVIRGLVLWSLAAIGDAAERRAGAEDAWRRAHAANPEAFLLLADALTPQVRAAARQVAGVLPGVRAGERAPVVVSPDARARLERWTQSVPEPARRPLLQALLASAEGRPLAQFEGWLREAAQAAPESVRLALLQVRLLEGRDAYEPALEALERARALGASPAALDLAHGELLWFRGKGNDAVKVWDALAHRSPTDPHGLCAAAWAYMARDEDEAAVRTAAEALRKAPELTSALIVQGMSLQTLSRDAEAEACFEQVLELEGAIYGRAPLFEVDAELAPLIRAAGWRGESTPEIDARMERIVSLLGIGGATTRLVAVQNALHLGPGTVWFGRCHEWLDDAQRAEPDRPELDMWHGWVALNERGTKAEDVLRYWRRAREREPRTVLSRAMRDRFRQRFGDHEELAAFPEK